MRWKYRHHSRADAAGQRVTRMGSTNTPLNKMYILTVCRGVLGARLKGASRRSAAATPVEDAAYFVIWDLHER